MNMDRGSRRVRVGKKLWLVALAAVLLGALGVWHARSQPAGYDGDGGPATQATLWAPLWVPEGVAVDAQGNLFIGDPRACVVREVHAESGHTTIVAGNGRHCALADGETWDAYLSLQPPQDLAVDGHGNLFIVDPSSARVREVYASSGIITTVAGDGQVCNGFTGCGDGGPATRASFFVVNIAMDEQGDLFIVDSINDRVREVHAGSGIVITVAGAIPLCHGSLQHCAGWLLAQPLCSEARGVCADGVPATRAQLYGPETVAVDRHGNLFIGQNTSEYGTGAGVREVSAGSGIITRVRGLGNGDPITRTLDPVALAVDGQSNLFISDAHSRRILEVHSGSGGITTVAGNGQGCALTARCGDGGPATRAALTPGALALDGHGHLFIADPLGYRVRRVDLHTGLITTVAGPRGG